MGQQGKPSITDYLVLHDLDEKLLTEFVNTVQDKAGPNELLDSNYWI